MNEELSQEVSTAHIEDTSGLKEIQKAMDKINELSDSNQSDSQPEETISENKSEVEPEVQTDDEDESTSQSDSEEVEAISEDDSTPDNEEEIKKPETRKQKEKKFWKERREKYKALAERDKLVAELEELKSQRDKALEVGNYHYGQNAYSDLEKAKMLKKKAIEEGDIEALTDADIAINRVTNAIDEIERWNAQNQSQPTEKAYNTYQGNTSAVQQEMAQDWLESHDEINPQSSNYNPQLAQKVGAFINQLDRNIVDSGQSQYYFSEPYFEAIDNHLDKLKTASAKSAPPSVNNVAGVKKSYQSQPGTQKKNTVQVKLTADEKNWAEQMGISEKDYLKYKLEDQVNKKRV